MTSQLVDVFPQPAPAADARTRPAPKSPRGRSWLREPLLHFVALGGLLFALDHFIVSRTAQPNVIVVGADVDSEAIHTFEQARGRKPNAQELEALHRVWIDNEVLYREGLALGVDKGDPAIRERVIFKALSVVDSEVKLPEADDTKLRAWFEANRNKYDEPARFDFEEAALAGKASEAEVRAFVSELNGGTPGDAKAGLRVFKARPRPSLVDTYGEDFAKALEAAKLGEWQALATRDGWRAIHVLAISPPQPAVYEQLRGPILHDWKDTVASEQRTAKVRELAKQYTIQFQQPIHEHGPE
jgi:hypothetical protein